VHARIERRGNIQNTHEGRVPPVRHEGRVSPARRPGAHLQCQLRMVAALEQAANVVVGDRLRTENEGELGI
jgi:hypothetical protein